MLRFRAATTSSSVTRSAAMSIITTCFDGVMSRVAVPTWNFQPPPVAFTRSSSQFQAKWPSHMPGYSMT